MRVLVAMSGGVDSSVAAALLVEAGHEVVGAHMKLHDEAPSAVPAGGAQKTCCGLDDALDARRVADTLGFPFYVLNLRDAFRKAVMDEFAAAYLAGRTPNPCIQCNGILKFRVLLARARAMDCTHLATGHYARVVDGPTGRSLAAAVDPDKDQSYFLFPLTQDAIDHAIFPLGGMTKAEVRGHARRLGLITAEKAESQEVCFIPDQDVGRFVRAHANPGDTSGEIVDETGEVLGRHDGYHQYTVGQRKGLGLALGSPAYVVRVEPESRRVVVSTDAERLLHHGLVLRGANWQSRPDPARRISVRIRHRGRMVPCFVGPGDAPDVVFAEPARAVTPGQAAVFYDGERVVGGGWIARAIADARLPTEAEVAR